MNGPSPAGLRLGYLIETFYPPTIGGLELHAYLLSQALARQGVEISVITRQTEPRSADAERVGALALRRLRPAGRLKGKGWRALAPIAGFLARIFGLLLAERARYDLLLVCGLKTLSIPSVLAGLITGRPCVIQLGGPAEVHEDISGESLRTMNKPGAAALLRLVRGLRNPLLRRADGFIAVSQEISQQLLKLGIAPERIYLLPNGIDIARFHPVAPQEQWRLRAQLGLPLEQKLFVFTGRIVATKGLQLLLEVWSELARQHADIHLALVGPLDGSFDNCGDELHAYAQAHGVAHTLTLTGSTSNVEQYLQAADVYVFPSEYEGFSLALLEALACGLPAVATRVGGADQVIQSYQNGILINPRDREDTRRALVWLLEHQDLWAALGASARQSVDERYSMEAVARSYLALFQEILERRAGAQVRSGAASRQEKQA